MKIYLLSITIVASLVITACSIVSSQKSPTTVAETKKPYNIVMIAVDDLNNWVGSWGGEAYTPNIDKLATEGTQFLNAYAAVPACNPSRVAILTGMRPERTGAYLNETNFRDLAAGKNIETMPQYFSRLGYESTAAGKIFHHPRGQGKQAAVMSDDVSWDYQEPGPTGTGGANEYVNIDGWGKWHNGLESYEGLPIIEYIRKHGIWGPIKQTDEQTGDFHTANYCANYLNQDNDKPFFLACGIFRPHSPQLAPQKYFDMYPLDKIKLPDLPNDDMTDIPEIAKTNWSSGFTKLLKSRPDEWRRAVQGYLASTTFADAMIGHILNAVKESGHSDDTIVVLWSDHGFQLGHKDRWEKFTLWKQGANAPMIIKAPGIKHGVVEAPVSLIDIFPTLIDLTDNKPKDNLDGLSLSPLMNSPKQAWPYPAVVTYQEGNNSVLLNQWNFIQYKDGSQELYDQENDPHEYNNLANKKQYQKIIEQLKVWLPNVEVKQAEYRHGG